MKNNKLFNYFKNKVLPILKEVELEDTENKLLDKKEETKYIIDFGDQAYGVIVTGGNRKEMYCISSNPPGLAQPKQYTFDEITATNLNDYSTLKKV